MDTNTSDIYCIMNFTVALAANLRFDAFALIDCVLICENQTAYIKFLLLKKYLDYIYNEQC